MTLYEKISFLRTKKGLSQSELERQAGLSKGTITNWKKDTIPNVESLKKVCLVLQCDINYLTGDDSKQEDTYYLNDETKAIAQEIFENKDMRTLFDMSRKMTPDRLKAHIEFMKNLQDSENE